MHSEYVILEEALEDCQTGNVVLNTYYEQCQQLCVNVLQASKLTTQVDISCDMYVKLKLGNRQIKTSTQNGESLCIYRELFKVSLTFKLLDLC